MNKLDIFEAVNMIDDDIVKEAAADNAKSGNTYDKDITVSGVEKYGGITWHRIAAIASAVLLIAGIGAGGALMLKRRPPLLVESVDTTAEDTTENNGLKAVSGKEKSSSENAEVTTVQSPEADVKETKESVNTEEPTAEEKDTPDENVTDGNTDVSGEEDVAAVTTAVAVTPQWKTSPANVQTLPKPTTTVTVQIHYPAEIITEPVTDQPADVFKMLDSLNYHAISCDGLPEYKLTASDGTVYLLNISGGWVWRRPSLIAEADNEAPLTQEVIDVIYANWDQINIVKTKW